MNKIDLTDKRFGRLVVMTESDQRLNGRTTWKCKCDCGNTTLVTSDCLRRKNGTSSCGCISIERIRNLNKGKSLKEDITGQKFGRLTVIEFSHIEKRKTYWKCRCDCGKEIITRADGLKNGHTSSCGCYNKEILQNATHNIKHGFSKKRIYHIWEDMKNRCYAERGEQYCNYGGRGISVCDEWLGEDGAKKFIKWAYANGYDENAQFGECTLDRIDVNGNYEPQNCRWVSAKKQANNTRKNLYISYMGETKTLAEWCEHLGLPYHTIKKRIYSGWNIEDAFLKPIGNNGRKKLNNQC